MVVAKNEATRAICRKGFGNSNKRGKDHKFFDYLVNEVPVARTCVSHGGGKDIRGKLLRNMAKEVIWRMNNSSISLNAKCQKMNTGKFSSTKVSPNHKQRRNIAYETKSPAFCWE